MVTMQMTIMILSRSLLTAVTIPSMPFAPKSADALIAHVSFLEAFPGQYLGALACCDTWRGQAECTRLEMDCSGLLVAIICLLQPLNQQAKLSQITFEVGHGLGRLSEPLDEISHSAQQRSGGCGNPQNGDRIHGGATRNPRRRSRGGSALVGRGRR